MGNLQNWFRGVTVVIYGEHNIFQVVIVEFYVVLSVKSSIAFRKPLDL